jgi:hypothetical protein
MKKSIGNGRRGHVVAVGLASVGLERPLDFERFGIEGVDDAGTVDDEDSAVGDDRRSEDGVVRGTAAMSPRGVVTLREGTLPSPGVVFQLRPVFAGLGQENKRQKVRRLYRRVLVLIGRSIGCSPS